MSRVGKKVIAIPPKTEVSMSGYVLTVKGPLGTLTKKMKQDIEITIGASEITLVPKKLIVEGIGFKSEVKGKNLVLALGFSHPVNVLIPETLKVTAEKNVIIATGIDKEVVGEFMASVRALKKPEPYKGKGIRYEGEVVKRKQGKKTV